MTLSDKALEIKKVITMICDLLPVMVQVVKEILIMLKEIKTV